jgi:hypothetical protein
MTAFMILSATVIMVTAAAAQSLPYPNPRGENCAPGYRSSGGYCAPIDERSAPGNPQGRAGAVPVGLDIERAFLRQDGEPARTRALTSGRRTQCPLPAEADIRGVGSHSGFDPRCVKTLRGITAPEIFGSMVCGEQENAKICVALGITTKSDFVFTRPGP